MSCRNDFVPLSVCNGPSLTVNVVDLQAGDLSRPQPKISGRVQFIGRLLAPVVLRP